MVLRWVFQDPVAGDSYTFNINPDAGGTPTYAKNIEYQSTASPDGRTIVFEGLDQPKSATFSGTILTQGQYEAMVDWFNRRNPIIYTDDLSRQWVIYITQLEAQRKRKASNAWLHTYTVTYTVLSGPTVAVP